MNILALKLDVYLLDFLKGTSLLPLLVSPLLLWAGSGCVLDIVGQQVWHGTRRLVHQIRPVILERDDVFDKLLSGGHNFTKNKTKRCIL